MTPLDILEGIQARLKERWPEGESAYYTDYVPQGFRRPSFLVEVGPVEPEETGGGMVQVKLEARITAFLPVDPYHHSHMPDLCRRMTEIMALFGRGYFPVGGRSPHVVKVRGNYGYDYAEVTLSIQYSEAWEEEEKYPLCQSIHISIKQKEE